MSNGLNPDLKDEGRLLSPNPVSNMNQGSIGDGVCTSPQTLASADQPAPDAATPATLTSPATEPGTATTTLVDSLLTAAVPVDTTLNLTISIPLELFGEVEDVPVVTEAPPQHELQDPEVPDLSGLDTLELVQVLDDCLKLSLIHI